MSKLLLHVSLKGDEEMLFNLKMPNNVLQNATFYDINKEGKADFQGNMTKLNETNTSRVVVCQHSKLTKVIIRPSRTVQNKH